MDHLEHKAREVVRHPDVYASLPMDDYDPKVLEYVGSIEVVD